MSKPWWRLLQIFVAFSKKAELHEWFFWHQKSWRKNENLFSQQLHGICLDNYNPIYEFETLSCHMRIVKNIKRNWSQSQAFCRTKEMKKQGIALNCERANKVHFFFKVSFHHFPCTHPDQKYTTPNPLYVLHNTVITILEFDGACYNYNTWVALMSRRQVAQRKPC